MAKVKIDAERIDSFKVDDRGRVYLGKAYKNSEVELAIISDGDDDE